jgi:hypothetical protein
MRILIGIYLVLGLAETVMSSVIGYWAVRAWLAATRDGPRRSDRWEEALLIAFLSLIIPFLPLLAAYGLWKRWRLVRLVLLGMSWWSLAVCAFAVAVALAMLAGLTDGRALGVNDPPGVTLALAGAIAAFLVVQLWVLMRRSTREAFRSRAEQGVPPDCGGIP